MKKIWKNNILFAVLSSFSFFVINSFHQNKQPFSLVNVNEKEKLVEKKEPIIEETNSALVEKSISSLPIEQKITKDDSIKNYDEQEIKQDKLIKNNIINTNVQPQSIDNQFKPAQSIVNVLPSNQSDFLTKLKVWEDKFPQFKGFIDKNGVIFVNGNHKAFKNMTLPDNFYLPLGTISIEAYAFDRAIFPNSFELPDSIKNIEPYAFQNALFNGDFKIPDLIKNVKPYSFIGAIFFGNINFNFVNAIGTKAFTKCQFSSLLDLSKVSQMYDYAFAESVGEHDPITSVSKIAGSNVFKGWQTSATDITVWRNLYRKYANKITIDGIVLDEAFVSEELPANFQLPATTTKIMHHAFLGAKIPFNFTLPSNVKKIEPYAFGWSTFENPNFDIAPANPDISWYDIERKNDAFENAHDIYGKLIEPTPPIGVAGNEFLTKNQVDNAFKFQGINGNGVIVFDSLPHSYLQLKDNSLNGRLHIGQKIIIQVAGKVMRSGQRYRVSTDINNPAFDRFHEFEYEIKPSDLIPTVSASYEELIKCISTNELISGVNDDTAGVSGYTGKFWIHNNINHLNINFIGGGENGRLQNGDTLIFSVLPDPGYFLASTPSTFIVNISKMKIPIRATYDELEQGIKIDPYIYKQGHLIYAKNYNDPERVPVVGATPTIVRYREHYEKMARNLQNDGIESENIFHVSDIQNMKMTRIDQNGNVKNNHEISHDDLLRDEVVRLNEDQKDVIRKLIVALKAKNEKVDIDTLNIVNGTRVKQTNKYDTGRMILNYINFANLNGFGFETYKDENNVIRYYAYEKNTLKTALLNKIKDLPDYCIEKIVNVLNKFLSDGQYKRTAYERVIYKVEPASNLYQVIDQDFVQKYSDPSQEIYFDNNFKIEHQLYGDYLTPKSFAMDVNFKEKWTQQTNITTGHKIEIKGDLMTDPLLFPKEIEQYESRDNGKQFIYSLPEMTPSSYIRNAFEKVGGKWVQLTPQEVIEKIIKLTGSSPMKNENSWKNIIIDWYDHSDPKIVAAGLQNVRPSNLINPDFDPRFFTLEQIEKNKEENAMKLYNDLMAKTYGGGYVSQAERDRLKSLSEKQIELQYSDTINTVGITKEIKEQLFRDGITDFDSLTDAEKHDLIFKASNELREMNYILHNGGINSDLLGGGSYIPKNIAFLNLLSYDTRYFNININNNLNDEQQPSFATGLVNTFETMKSIFDLTNYLWERTVMFVEDYFKKSQPIPFFTVDEEGRITFNLKAWALSFSSQMLIGYGIDFITQLIEDYYY